MKKYDVRNPILFKTGVYALSAEKNFDFQLNRLINWDGGRLEDIEKIAGNIHTSADWKRELIMLGDQAMHEERIENAIAYYRMSEFFMYDGDPDKKKYYDRATALFYDYFSDYFSDRSSGQSPIIARYEVPYEDVKLPVWHLKPENASGKSCTGIEGGSADGQSRSGADVVLLHGGNDSYFEEFLFPALYLQQQGFEVYLFEGPGQGGVMRIQNKHFTHEWEKPVKAVLNHFRLDDVTIIGASLGGYLAPRAAAFDKRIQRVVAWSIFPCFQDVVLGTQKPLLQKLFHLLMKLHARPIINAVFRHKAKKEPIVDWGLKHGMYAYEARDPYEYARILKRYDLEPIGHLLTQDVLILGASQDHFIDYRLIGREIEMLPNVRSLTFRLFTDKEQAQNHCNAGNSKLVLDTMCRWIRERSSEGTIQRDDPKN